MANDSLKNKIMAVSPHIEMITRRLYWANVKYLSRFVKAKRNRPLDKLDYDKISDLLKSWGVEQGSLLVTHSSYGSLKGRGKNANEIIDFLLQLLGPSGTLAMPAMPKFNNSGDYEKYLTKKNLATEEFEYDVQESKITTGVLPLMLHKRRGSVRSRFPINTLVSLGPLSTQLFQDEFSNRSPLACGVGSAWQKVAENNGKILAFGTDLTHSLTSIHVSEDAYESEWPINDWYIEKNFKIVDKDFVQKSIIRERRPHWGALHYGERTLCKDLVKQGILRTSSELGVLIEMIDARELNNFLRAKQKVTPGYPYFWVKSI